jgi:hypothetical protein
MAVREGFSRTLKLFKTAKILRYDSWINLRNMQTWNFDVFE